MASGVVRVAGRFSAGVSVRLVEVVGEHVLRAQGGRTVGEATVDGDGVVVFDRGVRVGARYFACGYERGVYREVRCRGEDPAREGAAVLGQAPVGRV